MATSDLLTLAFQRLAAEIKAIRAGLTITNADKAAAGLTINRSVASTSTADNDIVTVNYLGVRQTWTNEKGQLRTSNTQSTADVALKIIVPNSGGAEGLQVLRVDGTVIASIDNTGKLVAKNVVGGVVVLAGAAAVPAGTPAGTLIVRY